LRLQKLSQYKLIRNTKTKNVQKLIEINRKITMKLSKNEKKKKTKQKNTYLVVPLATAKM